MIIRDAMNVNEGKYILKVKTNRVRSTRKWSYFCSLLSAAVTSSRWFTTIGRFRVFKYFVDPELIPGVDKRMEQYAVVRNSPMKIKVAENNPSYGTVNNVPLVFKHDTDNVCRTM